MKRSPKPLRFALVAIAVLLFMVTAVIAATHQGLVAHSGPFRPPTITQPGDNRLVAQPVPAASGRTRPLPIRTLAVQLLPLTGIYSDLAPPPDLYRNLYQRKDILFYNEWHGYLSGLPVTVFVGGFRSNPRSGMIYVEYALPDKYPGRLFIVSGTGLLRAVNWSGSQVLVASPTGATYWFQIPPQRFRGPMPPPAEI